MSKRLESKQDVIEWYWPDFLEYCIKEQHISVLHGTSPTVDNFWQWYITTGPLGLKDAGRYYTKERIEYV